MDLIVPLYSADLDFLHQTPLVISQCLFLLFSIPLSRLALLSLSLPYRPLLYCTVPNCNVCRILYLWMDLSVYSCDLGCFLLNNPAGGEEDDRISPQRVFTQAKRNDKKYIY